MKKELELYIHIPFCIRKCAYCDFLSGPADDDTIEKYVEALKAEIRSQSELAKDYLVTSIFFGGGTPSILSGTQMKSLVQVIRKVFEIADFAEISMEANPGTVTRRKLKAYRNAGINRISFGLQSTNDKELKVLGRIHSYKEFLKSFSLARECGFDNINVDLISAIPNQTVESWEESVRNILALEPEHISAYSLIVEEGTPFYEKYGEGAHYEDTLPSEEDERLMYQRTEELLEEAGYHRYEISNYAKHGKECRHNLGYWERKEYLGLGLGSSSLIRNARFKNCDDLEFYMEHSDDVLQIREIEGALTKEEQMEEFVFLGMRKKAGISLKKFEKIFGKSLEECYGKGIKKMKSEQLIEEEDGMLKLTNKGIDISNYVFAEILYEQEE
jgi:oxygen-independent coproporphyrinogen-3 oxidase